MNELELFISIIKDIKKQIADKHKGYSMGGNTMNLSSNGFSLNIRTDCSGFVSACVSCLKKKNIIFSTYTEVSSLTPNGFEKISFPGWNNLKQGDILLKDTHTEIFSHNDGNRHYVWNCGNTNACNTATQTISGGGPYHTILRLKSNNLKGESKMSNSPLVSYTRISPNQSGHKKYKIDRITPHCIVGQMSVESLGEWFSKSTTRASSNYGIGADGRVGMYVEENCRAWTSSSSENDNRSVTIECASDLKPPYAFKDVVFNTLVKLCVDICKRNGKNKLVWPGSKAATLSYIPKENEMLLTLHRYYSSTSCLPVETEVLTKEGWKQIKDIKIGDEIASADLDNLNITFEKVYDKIDEKYQDVYKLLSGCMATLDHRMVFRTTNDFLYRVETLNRLLEKSMVFIPMAGKYKGKGLDISDDLLRLLIATQADGHYMYDKKVDGTKSYYGLEFHLKKERKITRIEDILKKLDFKYTICRKSDKSTSIRIYHNTELRIVDLCEKYLKNKCFTWDWIELNEHQVKIFCEEILLWDGTKSVFKYSSMDDINLDVVSAIYALNDIGSYTNKNTHDISRRDNAWKTLSGKSIRYCGSRKEKNTLVSCISVKTGLILIRQEGRTFIVGNCPGEWLIGKLNKLCNLVNQQLNGSSSQSKQKYKKDEVVVYNGNIAYSSPSATIGVKCRPGKARINSYKEEGIHKYHLIGIGGPGSSGVYGWVDESNISTINTIKPEIEKPKDEKINPYKIRVLTEYLNIRKGPGTNYSTLGKYTGANVFTIVEESNGQGASKWGLLKGYASGRDGWISLDSKFVEKL